MLNKKPYVFIAYNKNDKKFAQELRSRLLKDGANVWLDEDMLKIGAPLLDSISEGIEDVDFVAVILSGNSVKSNWVKKELSLANTKEVTKSKVVTLPILLDDCEIPHSVSDKVFADFRNDSEFESEYSKILRTVGLPVSTNEAVPSMSSNTEQIKTIGKLNRNFKNLAKELYKDVLSERVKIKNVDLSGNPGYRTTIAIPLNFKEIELEKEKLRKVLKRSSICYDAYLPAIHYSEESNVYFPSENEDGYFLNLNWTNKTYDKETDARYFYWNAKYNGILVCDSFLEEDSYPWRGSYLGKPRNMGVFDPEEQARSLARIIAPLSIYYDSLDINDIYIAVLYQNMSGRAIGFRPTSESRADSYAYRSKASEQELIIDGYQFTLKELKEMPENVVFKLLKEITISFRYEGNVNILGFAKKMLEKPKPF